MGDKSVSSTGVMAHLCALYGWMTWQFWSHTAAAVIWTIGVLLMFANIMERTRKSP